MNEQEKALREPNQALLDAWNAEQGKHRVKQYLLRGFECICGVKYNGDEGQHYIESGIAALATRAGEGLTNEQLLKIADHWQQQADFREQNDPQARHWAIGLRECANELRWTVRAKPEGQAGN
jgi:hypothetical protein